jgi:hypothetical protein
MEKAIINDSSTEIALLLDFFNIFFTPSLYIFF